MIPYYAISDPDILLFTSEKFSLILGKRRPVSFVATPDLHSFSTEVTWCKLDGMHCFEQFTSSLTLLKRYNNNIEKAAAECIIFQSELRYLGLNYGYSSFVTKVHLKFSCN